MSDLASRLAARARPPSEGPVMLPYLADRPADPRITPESALAEFGGLGDGDPGSVDEAVDADSAPFAGSLASPEARADAPRGAPSSGLLAPSERVATTSLVVHGDRSEVVTRTFIRESRATDRLLDRVHTTSLQFHASPPAAAIESADSPQTPAVRPIERSSEPSRDRIIGERPAEPQVAAPRPVREHASRPTDAPPALPRARERALEPTTPHARGAEPMHAPPEAPVRELHPAATTLHPRPRPVDLHTPISEPAPATVHIGSITVEVIQSAPRADARRVQAPPRAERPSAATKSAATSSRPLRTFGLRQL